MRPLSPDDAAHARLAASRAAIARSLAPDAGEGTLALLAPSVKQHPWALVGAAARRRESPSLAPPAPR